MLVKLPFVTQRLKISKKIFCHDQQRWGGGGQFLKFMGAHSCYEGGHRVLGGNPSLPHYVNPVMHVVHKN